MAPDSAGGLWLSTGPACAEGESIFYRFSDYATPELFSEAAHPIREFITAAAGGGDGSFWVTTNTNVLYRYDRQTGWDRMAVPGWDPGRVITNPSAASAIAIGEDGNGVVVGKTGRIADIGPGGAVLDAAAGILCSKQKTLTPPCGTGRDLRAASVAPEGSAMVGGDSRSLLYRQGGAGEFHAITPPPTAVYATITGISMPGASSTALTGAGPGRTRISSATRSAATRTAISDRCEESPSMPPVTAMRSGTTARSSSARTKGPRPGSASTTVTSTTSPT
jgi:hypothetical protein